MLYAPKNINRDKFAFFFDQFSSSYRCIRMALIHDIAESIIGDLTPSQAEKVDKHALETV